MHPSSDVTVIGIYAVPIFALVQWVSREKGTHQKNPQIDYSTSTGFNLGTLAVLAILIIVYAVWWQMPGPRFRFGVRPLAEPQCHS
jgi:hypothetical protein